MLFSRYHNRSRPGLASGGEHAKTDVISERWVAYCQDWDRSIRALVEEVQDRKGRCLALAACSASNCASVFVVSARSIASRAAGLGSGEGKLAPGEGGMVAHQGKINSWQTEIRGKSVPDRLSSPAPLSPISTFSAPALGQKEPPAAPQEPTFRLPAVLPINSRAGGQKAG